MKGYGKYIPFISVTENGNNCENAVNLIDYDSTVPINPYLLGSKATADTCDVKKITCIYDEALSSDGSNPRFFETGNTIAFYLTMDPMDVENWENTDYSGSDVIFIIIKH